MSSLGYSRCHLLKFQLLSMNSKPPILYPRRSSFVLCSLGSEPRWLRWVAIWSAPIFISHHWRDHPLKSSVKTRKTWEIHGKTTIQHGDSNMGILGYQGLTIQHFGDRKTGQNPPHKVISPIQIAGASGISHGFPDEFLPATMKNRPRSKSFSKHGLHL